MWVFLVWFAVGSGCGLDVVIDWFCVARFLWHWCFEFGFAVWIIWRGLGGWFDFAGLRLAYVCNFGFDCWVWFSVVCDLRVVILSLVC